MNKLGAIILAAGKGTRMKSNKPKVLFEIAGKSLVQHVIDAGCAAGCTDITAIVGYKKEEVKESLSANENILYADQDEQLGTGHAVMMARDNFVDYDGDVYVLCGDVPLLTSETLKKMYAYHKETSASCTVLTAVMEDPARYGRIVRDDSGNISKIVEFKDASNEQRDIKEINTGIYIYNCKDLFNSLSKINNKNAQGEYYLTDTLELLNAENKTVSGIVLDNVIEASGINSQKQLSELEVSYYRSIKDKWMESGVYIENPDTVIIGPDVEIQNDVVIRANTIVKGKSVIESNTEIGPFSFLKDAVIKSQTILNGYNVIISRSIDANSRMRIMESLY